MFSQPHLNKNVDQHAVEDDIENPTHSSPAITSAGLSE